MLRFGGKAVALPVLGFGQVARHVTGFMMGGGGGGGGGKVDKKRFQLKSFDLYWREKGRKLSG